MYMCPIDWTQGVDASGIHTLEKLLFQSATEDYHAYNINLNDMVFLGDLNYCLTDFWDGLRHV